MNIKSISLIFSSILGAIGIFLAVWLDNQIRLTNNINEPTIAYYTGISLLIVAILIYLTPIIIPPKKSIPLPPFTIKCPFCDNKLSLVDNQYKCLECNYSINDDPILISMKDLATLVDLALFNCSNSCQLFSKFGVCEVLLRYARVVNASIPLKCPLIHALKNQEVKKESK